MISSFCPLKIECKLKSFCFSLFFYCGHSKTDERNKSKNGDFIGEEGKDT